MKRISLLMVALLLMSGIVMAQGGRRGGDKKKFDPKEYAERTAAHMAKEYSLNDTQKKQLVEINLAHGEKVGKFGQRMKQGNKDNKCTQDSCCCSKKKGNEAPKMSKEDREKKRAEAKELRESYDAQLKKIMTQEQYDSYIKKQAERRQKMKEGRKRG